MSHVKVTKLVRLPFCAEEYLATSSGWFADYVRKSLEESHDCYLEKIGKASGILMLGKPIIWLPTGTDEV